MTFRKVSKEKYVLAFLLTTFIFAFGLVLGLYVQEQRYDWATSVADEQEINYMSLQLQYLFLTTFDLSENCAVLQTSLRDSIDDLSDSLAKVIEFEEEEDFVSDDFIMLQRRYTLDNIRYWVLAEKAKTSCGTNTQTVLYFYNSDCETCPDQGTVLTYFKKLLQDDLLVFPINTDVNDPMVDIMTNLYEIQEYPSIVINTTKYEGLQRKDVLEGILCDGTC